ncbi:MAG: ComEA family DNA-binding protein [Acidimicrobiia bacterium]
MERTWIAAATVVALAGGALLVWPSNGSTPPPFEIVAGGRPEGRLTVHVSGAVARPGLVSLPGGSRIADAILAAGGARADALLTALNLAATVVNGQQLVVPAVSPADSAISHQDGRVAINLADAVALEALPGVGPVLAQRIVEHRERFGPFAVVEDLLDVPGIGEAKLAALREIVLVP